MPSGTHFRLGRLLRHLIDTVTDLQAREINFLSLTENIDTSTPSGKFTFHLFGALAEMERDIIRQRAKAGLDAARARGRKGGRPKAIDTIDPKKLQRAKELYAFEASRRGPSKPLWSYPVARGISPVVANGVVYVSSYVGPGDGPGDGPGSGKLYALGLPR